MEAVRASIELGPGAGNTIFKNLRIGRNVKVGEMGAIKQEFDRLKPAWALPARRCRRTSSWSPLRAIPA